MSVPSTAPAIPKPLPGKAGRSCSRPLGCGETTAAIDFGQDGNGGVLGFSFTGCSALSLGAGGGALVCGTVEVTSSSFSSASAYACGMRLNSAADAGMYVARSATMRANGVADAGCDRIRG